MHLRLRRFLPLACLFALAGSVTIPQSGAQAASFTPLHPVVWHIHSFARAAADVTTPQALQLQWPAGALKPASQVVDAAAADASTNVFNLFHDSTHTYAAAGMQGGIEQNAGFVPAGTTAVINAYWLGSYYATDAQAAARVQQTIDDEAALGLKSTSCGANCATVGVRLTISGTPYGLFYAIGANQNAVGEMLFTITESDLQANSAAVETEFKTNLQAFDDTLNGLSSTQAPATVSITSAGVYRPSKGALAAVKSLKSGQKGTFVAVAGITGGDATLATGQITFARGSNVLGTIPLVNKGTQADGTVLFASAPQGFKTTKSRTLTATVTIMLGAVSAQQTFTFKVTPKKPKKH